MKLTENLICQSNKLVNLTLTYFCSEPTDVLSTRLRMRRDTEEDDDVTAKLGVLPRIPNPVICLSAGDMLIFGLTIIHTGTISCACFHTGLLLFLGCKNLGLNLFYILQTAGSAISQCIKKTTCLTVTPAGTLVPLGICKYS